MLLAFSHFPISGPTHCEDLCSAIERALEDEEIRAWKLFLRDVSARKSEMAAWLRLLEAILAYPQRYGSQILTVAMERYTALI